MKKVSGKGQEYEVDETGRITAIECWRCGYYMDPIGDGICPKCRAWN